MVPFKSRPSSLIAKSFEFARDFPSLSLGDKISSASTTSSIPRSIYQTWEEKKFGRTHFLSLKKFRNLNPNFDFYLLDAAERDAFVRSNWYGSPLWEMYERARFGQIKADLFRYLIVAERGGFYFDISKAINLPVDNFLEDHYEALISFERTPRPPHLRSNEGPGLLHADKLVLQWGFGFKRHHEILRILLKQITADYLAFDNAVQVDPKGAILRLTGPLAFTRAVDTYFLQKPRGTVGQVSTDFAGMGILNMPGSAARHKIVIPYASIRNERLFA
jgi:mannosyltransferase OCH1-like enzyme